MDCIAWKTVKKLLHELRETWKMHIVLYIWSRPLSIYCSKKKIDDWSQDEFLVSSVDPLEHEAVYIEQYSQGNIAFPYVVINHDH